LTADNKNGTDITKTEKVRADYKQGCAKIEVTNKHRLALQDSVKQASSQMMIWVAAV
jgi:hypothetical protein